MSDHELAKRLAEKLVPLFYATDDDDVANHPGFFKMGELRRLIAHLERCLAKSE